MRASLSKGTHTHLGLSSGGFVMRVLLNGGFASQVFYFVLHMYHNVGHHHNARLSLSIKPLCMQRTHN